jgi:DNA-binding NarL/FixJ family response regulator
MSKGTILFADNDTDFLNIRKEFLEMAGYQVITTASSIEARMLLEQAQVDLAILDVRLLDDSDDKDVSGLKLAKETTRSVPKIILTGFPTYEAVREALGPDLEGLAPASDFLAKQEGPQALLRAVREVFRFELRQFHETIEEISEQLERNYEEARRQARADHWTSVGLATAGILILLAAIALAFLGKSTISAVSVIGGIVAEGMGFLLFKRVAIARERMEQYIAERAKIIEFEASLAACNELSSSDEQDECRRRVMKEAIERWFASRTNSTC